MIITLNILHCFGLAKPIAEFLNARAEKKTVWTWVTVVSFLAAGGVLPVFKTTEKVFNEGTDHFFALMCSNVFLILLIALLLEIGEMAMWYGEKRKLVLYGKSWVMLRSA